MDIVVPVVVTFLLFIFFVGIAFITALAKNGDRLIRARLVDLDVRKKEGVGYPTISSSEVVEKSGNPALKLGVSHFQTEL